ncbi:MAG: hypothetical protein RLP44_04325 [Aggregatilineales bacterium]
MDIQLEERIVLQLQEIAKVQEREIIDILRDAISQYVEEHTNASAFREVVDETIQRHKWLLDELKER